MISSTIKLLLFIVNHPLNRKARALSLWQFLRWQLGSALTGSRVLIDWVDETKILVRKGEKGLTGNLYCGFMEFADMCFLLHYLRSTDDFFDIGANAGAYTLLASGVIGARSTSFEPLPNTFDRFLDQVNINRILHLVKAENKGVGDKAGVLEFTNADDCMNHVNTDPKNIDVTKVEVISLDESYQPTNSTFVKIDVEGYESFVLDGGKMFFANNNVDAIIIETNGSGAKYGVEDAAIDARIREFGFHPVAYEPSSRLIKVMATFNSKGNTIYIKNLEKAKRRCSEAEKVIVHTAHGIEI